jgi:hypothetical protein
MGRMRNRLAVAIIFMVAAMMAAGATADIKPTLRMEFQVQESNLSDVMEILTRYARKEGFTVEDTGPHMPPKDNRPIFYVNLRRPDSTKIIVTNFLEKNQMLLFLYVPKQDTQFQQLIDPLISEIRERWPDIHVYTGL